VRRGEALGVATPANRLLHAIVKLIESKVADLSLPLEAVA
jgi:2-dehydropantoate 2-reductase